jgi:hypothetical protein
MFRDILNSLIPPKLRKFVEGDWPFWIAAAVIGVCLMLAAWTKDRYFRFLAWCAGGLALWFKLTERGRG